MIRTKKRLPSRRITSIAVALLLLGCPLLPTRLNAQDDTATIALTSIELDVKVLTPAVPTAEISFEIDGKEQKVSGRILDPLSAPRGIILTPSCLPSQA